MSGEIKSASEIGYMREAGHIVHLILDELARISEPGISTWDLDRVSEDLIYKNGAKPAFKGYRGFPCCLCTSINHEVVHGIPSKKRVLKDGDIISLDFGVVFKGYYGDSAVTVPVGAASSDAIRLIDTTRASLSKGIEKMVEGNRISDIGAAVQAHAESNGYSVVRSFVGHGIGRALHEDPQVPNYDLTKDPRHERLPNPRLRKGMVLAVEPMVNVGTPEVEVLADDWTAVTCDRKLSAHFEHTIVVGDNGPEILTV